MSLRKLGGITLGAMLSMVMVQGLNAANNTGAVLLRPKQKEKVQNVTEVTGKILLPGYPIVLVRDDQPGGMWWAQEWAESTSPGLFKAQARIGNDKTANGTRFQIVVVMVPRAEDAKKFEPGTSFKELPSSLARSAEIVVVLDKPQDLTAATPELIRWPEVNGLVARVDSVLCAPFEDKKPIILVRSTESNDVWWVQSDSQHNKDGHFVSTAHFGNEKTAAGTRFRIVAIFPEAELAAKLLPGTSLKELPMGVPRSAQVEVSRKSAAEASQTAASPSTAE